MFSIRRFEPASGTNPDSSQTKNDVNQNSDTPLTALSRLNARLEAKRQGITQTSIETPPVEPAAPIISHRQAENPPEEDHSKSLNGTDDEAQNNRPITRKQKARIDLGLTGANAIPLPSLDPPKPKTSAKKKYLKRKKQRHQARKKSTLKADHHKETSKQGDEGSDCSSQEEDELVPAVGPQNLETVHVPNPQAPSDVQVSDEDECLVKLKERKRPKNLDGILESIQKKRKKKQLSSVEGHNLENTKTNSEPITQPGSLPRFPAPVNPSLPDPQLLARFAMGLGEVNHDNKQSEDDMIQIDSQSTLKISNIKIRGESPQASQEIRLSAQSLTRLKEINIQNLLPGSRSTTPSALLYPILSPPRDICVSAPTGSGKTLSYVVPIIETLATRVVARLRALIVLPTRDLVLQVKTVFDLFSQGTGLKSAIVTGQHSFIQEQSLLTGTKDGTESCVDVLIATPGRLIDHLNHTPGFSLQHLCFLVLDEADQLLNKSQAWLNQLLNSLNNSNISRANIPTLQNSAHLLLQPTNLQLRESISTSSRTWTLPIEASNPCRTRPFRILLFSATLRRDPTKLAHLGLRKPVFIKIGDKTDEDYTDNLNTYTLPTTLEIQKALCFCKSVEGANRLTSLYRLMVEGSPEADAKQRVADGMGTVACFSSDLKASDRKKMLLEFEAGDINMLICSDVIARGLDIPSVQHVINYDSPVDAKKYIHRVGRTARAGESGTAWSLVEAQEAKFLKVSLKEAMGEESCKKIQRLRIKRSQLEDLMPIYEVALIQLGKIYGRTSSNPTT